MTRTTKKSKSQELTWGPDLCNAQGFSLSTDKDEGPSDAFMRSFFKLKKSKLIIASYLAEDGKGVLPDNVKTVTITLYSKLGQPVCQTVVYVSDQRLIEQEVEWEDDEPVVLTYELDVTSVSIQRLAKTAKNQFSTDK